ncbi:MAG: L-threonylcarbamoyladenylate synthase [Lachnospiraceae bacterium]
MKTIYTQATADAIQQAGAILKNGGLVAFPTETVYGLGGNALDSSASQKIYQAKGRPSDNPLIAHVANIDQVTPLVTQISDEAKRLMKIFWPGPLTIILPKSKLVPQETTGGLNTVALRCPDNPIALAMIEAAGVPIAAPSANTSGRPSPTNAHHVLEDMDGKIEMILDGGECHIGLESTIIDMSEEEPTLLRPGFITKEMLEHALGHEIKVDAAVTRQVSAGVRPKAPGMNYRHYAPKATLILVSGERTNIVASINQLTEKERKLGHKVGIICTDETISLYCADKILSMGSRKDMDSIAQNMFRVLREFDDTDIEIIYSEIFSSEGLGFAIMNRLTKAAGHQFIYV